MAHLSEDSTRLEINEILPSSMQEIFEEIHGVEGVCVLKLPAHSPNRAGKYLSAVESLVSTVAGQLGPNATLIVLGESFDLVHVHAAVKETTRYQHWIAIKRENIRETHDRTSLPQHHFGALVHTKYKGPLKHSKTRIKYSYCPVCNKTTKDYGGKKHTYHEYGTLMSDVWRDLSCDLEGDLNPVLVRFADLLGIRQYDEMRVFDCKELLDTPELRKTSKLSEQKSLYYTPEDPKSELILGDCIESLRMTPDDSVDFAFADPPYNLKKKYGSYTDDLEIEKYFNWCDRWIFEMARVLRPGRTLALLNIPLWAIRHFVYLGELLSFQNWIVWDALSYPVRKIMPAHYAILCFSKGPSRELPGLRSDNHESSPFSVLEPLAEGLCLRQQCVDERKAKRVDTRGRLTDLWWDVHRLKHNSQRVDHPTQLPPQLMYRLISAFTEPEEMVLDCFNGAGTTTLAAHQLRRNYTGIEISDKYQEIARSRHEEIRSGIDPFRKADRKITAKNSPVPRRPKQKYEVSKRELQLEVRRVAKDLGKLPTRSELESMGEYPIRYYDDYFASWGEVCAAARTTGMSEGPDAEGTLEVEQLRLSELLFSPSQTESSRDL